MSFIEWTPEYQIGHPEIDKQHQHLVSLINNLYNAYTEGNSSSIVEPILNELVDYTMYHFNSEELHMDNLQYPLVTKHKEEHAYFIAKVDEFKMDFDQGNIFVSMDILEFLSSWILDHIAESDKELAKYL